MKKFCAVLTAAMLVLQMFCGAAFARDAWCGQTVSGVVAAVNGSEVSISTDDYGDISFMITADTEILYDMDEAPEKPDGEQGSGQGSGQAPEMPSGSQGGGQAPDMPSGSQGGGQAPDMPSGSQGGGQAPEMPSGGQGGGAAMEKPDQQNASPSADDIAVGTAIEVTFDEEGNAITVKIPMTGGMNGGSSDGMPGGMPGGSADGKPGDMPGGGGMGGGQNITYTADYSFSEDSELSSMVITSTGTDENAVLVTGGTVSVTDVSLTRKSDDSTGGDNSSFYGVGAAMLVTDGVLFVSDSTIFTDAAGAAGVFAYGSGTAYVSDVTIHTARNTSGGIHVAGGGTLYADNVTAETYGESSAAIRSDRGSGTMIVSGGSFTSNGIGSPAIYSTADITVSDADLSAVNSEAICIEGLNSIRLYDCNLSGAMQDSSQNDCTWNVILYQSMSGDSEVGNSLFEMVGGTLTAENGGMFYTTNTESTFVLSDVAITYAPESPFLLRCTGNANARGWGKTGANGAACSFTAISQELRGNVIWDSVSTLDMFLTDGSTLTGAFLDDESCAGTGGSGFARLVIDSGSSWVVTADSYVPYLENAGTIVDAEGSSVTIVGTDGVIYASGTGSVTVTVQSYTADADLSGARTVSTFASSVSLAS